MESGCCKSRRDTPIMAGQTSILLSTKELRLCFDQFSEGKGYIDKFEMKLVHLALFGYSPSRLEIQSMLESHFPNTWNTDLRLDWDTFFDIMKPRLDAGDHQDEIEQMFQAFDLDQTGFITYSNFKHICAHVIPMVSEEIAWNAFAEADSDNDGRVSYRDFQRLMHGWIVPT